MIDVDSLEVQPGTILTPGTRYQDLERLFIRKVLSNSMQGTAMREYTHRVVDRLAQGGKEYGEAQFWRVPISQLFQEIREELDDVLGWSALAAIRLVEAGQPEMWTPFASEISRVVPLYHGLDAINAQAGEKVNSIQYPESVLPAAD